MQTQTENRRREAAIGKRQRKARPNDVLDFGWSKATGNGNHLRGQVDPSRGNPSGMQTATLGTSGTGNVDDVSYPVGRAQRCDLVAKSAQ